MDSARLTAEISWLGLRVGGPLVNGDEPAFVK